MFIPYLFFDGTAEAAMRFYCDVFAGEDLGIMTFGDVPDMLPANLKTDPDARARVLNASFTHANGRLMASDNLPGWDARPQAGCAVTHFAASRAEAERIFTALSENAEIEMPFGDVLWADGFGILRDRFGTNWMIGGPEPSFD